jgi:hypothetical protein
MVATPTDRNPAGFDRFLITSCRISVMVMGWRE